MFPRSNYYSNKKKKYCLFLIFEIQITISTSTLVSPSVCSVLLSSFNSLNVIIKVVLFVLRGNILYLWLPPDPWGPWDTRGSPSGRPQGKNFANKSC